MDDRSEEEVKLGVDSVLFWDARLVERERGIGGRPAPVVFLAALLWKLFSAAIIFVWLSLSVGDGLEELHVELKVNLNF